MAGPAAREEVFTEGGLVGDPPALEGGSTTVDLVVGPTALAGILPEGGRVGGAPVFVGGSTGACCRDRRVGAQTSSRRAEADRRDARLEAVDEHIDVVRVVGRRPKAAACPAAAKEGRGSQNGMVGAAALRPADGEGRHTWRRGRRNRHSDRTEGGRSGMVARTVEEEVGGGGGDRPRCRGRTVPYRCTMERAGRRGDHCGAVEHRSVTCPRRPSHRSCDRSGWAGRVGEEKRWARTERAREKEREASQHDGAGVSRMWRVPASCQVPPAVRRRGSAQNLAWPSLPGP